MTPTARKFVIASVLSGKNADSSGKKRLAESAPRAQLSLARLKLD
jgi:hypothetical protein